MIRTSTIFELVFFGYIFIISFSSLNRTKELLGFPVTGFFVFSIITLIVITPIYLYRRKKDSSSIIFVLFTFLIIYALVRAYTDNSFLDKSLYVIPIILAFLAALIPYSFSKLITNKQIDSQRNIYFVSLLITLVTTLYAINFYFVSSQTGRLVTPAGGAAVLHVALLLPLSVYIGSLRVGYKKYLSLIMTIVTITLIFQTGSRAGLITMLLLVFFSFFNFRKPLKTIALTLFLSLLFILFFQIMPTNRYENLESEARSITYETAINTFLDSPHNILLGTGTGKTWPWYAYESGNLLLEKGLVKNEHGYLLTNPHSVYLGTMTELGLIGFIPLIMIFMVIIKSYFSSSKNNDIFTSSILLAIICTLIAFSVDYYLFKNFQISAIWWYFVFFSVSSVKSNCTSKSEV